MKLALINVPLASAASPSIQIGLVSAIAKTAGYAVDEFHLNIEFAEEIGIQNYEKLCSHRGNLLGEWIFSHSAFGCAAPSGTEEYFTCYPSELAWLLENGLSKETIVDIRERLAPIFIQKFIDRVDWTEYRAIALSSTFQQICASIAVASRIKKTFCDATIIVGGANVDGEMGDAFFENFPDFDYVFSGEADTSLPEFLDLLKGNEVCLMYGKRSVLRQRNASTSSDLDALPTPDYSGYFDTLSNSTSLGAIESRISIPFENSRGCWWGAKHHCTFCGLNGSTMKFRSMSVDKTLSSINELSKAHSAVKFYCVDNILNHLFLDIDPPEFDGVKCDYEFFFEVKSNLRKDQLRTLRQLGATRVQPGIESLNSRILKLMRKGSTAIINVRFLKWCLYYGISVDWNLLWGFPGETPSDYEDELTRLKLISHLQPPVSVGRIWLERFSPYFFDSNNWGISNIQPIPAYHHVFPAELDLDGLAYFYTAQFENITQEADHEQTASFVSDWQSSWYGESRDYMYYERIPNGLIIRSRDAIRQRKITLTGNRARLYLACCQTMKKPAQLVKELEAVGAVYEHADVSAALRMLCDEGLMMEEGDLFLSLALPKGDWMSRRFSH